MICFPDCVALMSAGISKCRRNAESWLMPFMVWSGAFTYVNDLVYIRKWASRERACYVTITYQTPNPRSCTPVLSRLKACTHPFVDSPWIFALMIYTPVYTLVTPGRKFVLGGSGHNWTQFHKLIYLFIQETNGKVVKWRGFYKCLQSFCSRPES